MYGLRKIRLYSWYHWQAVAADWTWNRSDKNHCLFGNLFGQSHAVSILLGAHHDNVASPQLLSGIWFGGGSVFKEIFNGPCLDSFYINSWLNSEMQSSFVFMWKQRISGVVEAAIYSCAVLKKLTVIRMCNFIEFQFHFQIKHLSPCLALNEHGRTKLRRKARSSRKLYPK